MFGAAAWRFRTEGGGTLLRVWSTAKAGIAGMLAGIVATMICGSPPVIRFTVLGLQQVPEAVREAALAFGATPRYLLWNADLPLAAKIIMAGINQTILMSLATVVVASHIGTSGLGEDVLEALQYSSRAYLQVLRSASVH